MLNIQTFDARAGGNVLYKALAHPLRRRILAELRREPASATTLAQALGESTGATSYHLRELAKYGFIEEVSGGRSASARACRSLASRFCPTRGSTNLRGPTKHASGKSIRDVYRMLYTVREVNRFLPS